MTGREREGEIETIFYLLVHCPTGCSSQGWVRLEAGAWNSILVSLLRGRGSSTGAVSALPRCISRDLGQKQNSLVLSCGLVVSQAEA